MFIAPEVKGDLALEQAEFQSIVSGEDVSVAVKNKTAMSIEWKVPGVLGGNEVPNWRDNSGSVLRRILPWNFGKQVQDADPQLEEKLHRELPIILLKCVRGYLDYSNKYRNRDIWNAVPPTSSRSKSRWPWLLVALQTSWNQPTSYSVRINSSPRKNLWPSSTNTAGKTTSVVTSSMGTFTQDHSAPGISKLE